MIERPEAATDARFADAASLAENARAAADIVRGAIAEHTAAEWRERLSDFTGQWTVVQNTLEAAADPQTIANGLVADCETAEGVPFQLAAAPVQFGEEPAPAATRPGFNEHGDEILAGLGLDWDTILDLKVRGVVA